LSKKISKKENTSGSSKIKLTEDNIEKIKELYSEDFELYAKIKNKIELLKE